MMRTIFGLIYNELEDYGNAMVYHNKALASIDKKATAFRNQKQHHKQYRTSISKQENFKEAIKYFEKV
jgi:tetratricopeptide (TPR) repeat protein